MLFGSLNVNGESFDVHIRTHFVVDQWGFVLVCPRFSLAEHERYQNNGKHSDSCTNAQQQFIVVVLEQRGEVEGRLNGLVEHQIGCVHFRVG